MGGGEGRKRERGESASRDGYGRKGEEQWEEEEMLTVTDLRAAVAAASSPAPPPALLLRGDSYQGVDARTGTRTGTGSGVVIDLLSSPPRSSLLSIPPPPAGGGAAGGGRAPVRAPVELLDLTLSPPPAPVPALAPAVASGTTLREGRTFLPIHEGLGEGFMPEPCWLNSQTLFVVRNQTHRVVFNNKNKQQM